MRSLRYHRVDVFTDRAFTGNPLAVFPDADEIDASWMQTIAREMNLSETVFVCTATTPGADLRLRIFTVDRELPMAGHPVIGAHYVLAATGRLALQRGTTTVQAELGVGVLPVELEGDGESVHAVVMTQRAPSVGPAIQDRALVASAIGLPVGRLMPDLPVRVVDTGVPWLMVPVVDARALAAVAPRADLCRELAQVAGTDAFYAFTQETQDPDCAVRARHVWFGPLTAGEDPVTGSAAGCLACYLVLEQVLLAAPTADIAIEQGVEIGRVGKVRAFVDAEGTRVRRIRVGGAAVHVGDGELWLP
jgi:trans-2,3-dihydro-3-hydroxyanthranilate isomerase